MRKLLIAGNWKMNMGPAEAETMLVKLKTEIPDIPESVEVLVCPPAITIHTVVETLQGYDVQTGAQNVYFEDNGAYTGEISTAMLNESGVNYVIIGHSERREYFGETDATVNKKVLKSLDDGIVPIICVGESLEQRKAGKHVDIVSEQVKKALDRVEAQQATDLVIAYEPIWAIGTGETATPKQAQQMHLEIRRMLEDRFDKDVAGQIRILYGGSMKPHNAEDLLGQTDVDGGLIGGASLQADSFAAIIQTAESLS